MSKEAPEPESMAHFPCDTDTHERTQLCGVSTKKKLWERKLLVGVSVVGFLCLPEELVRGDEGSMNPHWHPPWQLDSSYRFIGHRCCVIYLHETTNGELTDEYLHPLPASH
jgi:hypothetical protein